MRSCTNPNMHVIAISNLPVTCSADFMGIGWRNGGYARLEMTDGGFGPCAMYK